MISQQLCSVVCLLHSSKEKVFRTFFEVSVAVGCSSGMSADQANLCAYINRQQGSEMCQCVNATESAEVAGIGFEEQLGEHVLQHSRTS